MVNLYWPPFSKKSSHGHFWFWYIINIYLYICIFRAKITWKYKIPDNKVDISSEPHYKILKFYLFSKCSVSNSNRNHKVFIISMQLRNRCIENLQVNWRFYEIYRGIARAFAARDSPPVCCPSQYTQKILQNKKV